MTLPHHRTSRKHERSPRPTGDAGQQPGPRISDTAARVILPVAKVSPRVGPSWARTMPLEANAPTTPRHLSARELGHSDTMMHGPALWILDWPDRYKPAREGR